MSKTETIFEKEVRKNLREEKWVIEIAKQWENNTWADIENIVENFILKYWVVEKSEITPQFVADIIKIAKEEEQ